MNLFNATLGRVGRSGDVTERRPIVLADLPGYGYAEMSKADRAKLSRLLSHYLAERDGLTAVVHLFDARHAPTAQDVDVYEEVASLDALHVLVATKADKLPASKRAACRVTIAKPLGVPPSTVLLFSSETNIGRDELLAKLWERVGEVA